MAVVAEELISELVVRDGKLRSGLRSAQQTYSQGIGQMRGETRKMEQEFTRSSGAISSSFKAMAASLAAGVSVGTISGMIDGYTRLQNQLRVTGLEGQALADVQERLRQIGNQYGTDLESLATVYGRVSVAAKELGASSEQILSVNEAIAAALKVSGTSSAEASGALLQFSQAMGSGVVRAEEFNSMLEGAFPLVQAAARGIDGMEGSVSKLRAAILEGNVTSQQFFQGVLAGAPALIEQASKANATLAQSFTTLKNELMLYVGSASSSNGVTAALAEGISKLAENLDRIVPALAIIISMIGVRWAASMAAATAATVAKGAATARETAFTQAYNVALAQNAGLLNAQAVAMQRGAAAAGGMAVAARGAGAALLAAVGGPVGAATIALGAALAYLYGESKKAEKAASDLKSQLGQSEATLISYISRLESAGVKTDALGRISDIARGKVDGLAESFNRASAEAHKLATQTSMATIEILKQQAAISAESKGRQAGLERQLAYAEGRDPNNRGASRPGVIRRENPEAAALRAQIADEKRVQQLADATQEAVKTAFENGVSLASPKLAGGGGAAAADEKKKKGRSGGRSGPTPEEIEARYSAELERGLVEIEQINAERRQNASEMAAAEVSRIRVEQQITARAIKADADYSEAQKRVLLAVNDQHAAARVQAIGAEEEARISDERREMMQLELDIQRDAMQRAYDLADTQSERRTISLAMLDLEERVRTAKLDELLAQENLSDAVRQRAERERAAIGGEFAGRRESAMRETEGPLERWRRETSRTAEQMEEDLQRVQANGFEALTDGITGTISKYVELGGVAGKVINGIISDLIRLQVQQLIVKSLGGLFGGGGDAWRTPGIGDLVGPIGARAGGGRVQAGQIYRINESSQEYFRPDTSGTVINTPQLNNMARGAGGGQPVVVQLSVAEGGLFETRVRAISGDVSVQTVQAAAPALIKASSVDARRTAARPRA